MLTCPVLITLNHIIINFHIQIKFDNLSILVLKTVQYTTIYHYFL